MVEAVVGKFSPARLDLRPEAPQSPDASVDVPIVSASTNGAGRQACEGEIPWKIREREVVDLAKAGDGKARNELCEAYWTRIFRYILVRVDNFEDAKDTTQEVFKKVFKKLPDFKWKTNPKTGKTVQFSSWIFTIAKHKIIDLYQKEHPYDTYLSCPLPESSMPFATPEESVTFGDVIESGDNLEETSAWRIDIQKSLMQLTPREQEVFRMCLVEELSRTQVARMLGISESNVKSTLHNAKRKLRGVLGNQHNGFKEEKGKQENLMGSI